MAVTPNGTKQVSYTDKDRDLILSIAEVSGDRHACELFHIPDGTLRSWRHRSQRKPPQPYFPAIPGLRRDQFSYLGHGMFAAVILATPEMMSGWLARNIRNRRLTQTRVDMYARAMAADLWPLNGEPAIFDSEGNLMSFQHRARAIMRADRPILTLVVVGVDPAAMSTIDVGKPRTGGDVLKIVRDIPNANEQSAMVGWVYRYKYRLSLNAAVEPVEADRALQAHPGIAEWVSVCRKVPVRSVPKTMFAGIAYMCSRVNEGLAQQMVDGMATGERLRKYQPVHTLRESALANAANRGGGIKGRTWWVYFVKTWNALYEGREMRQLRFNPDEKIPDIAGLDRSIL